MLPYAVRHGRQSVVGHSSTELYLELLKRTLVNWIYRNGSNLTLGRDPRDEQQPWRRDVGKEWREPAHTMAGLKRLDNVHACIDEVLSAGVPGDFIETGVWRGGVPIFMRAVLAAHDVSDRVVWLADSFNGLPPPTPEKYPEDAGYVLNELEELRVSLEQVQSHFERYGLLDDQVRFLKGWFRDTLPEAPIESIAVLRLDGDLYESTMDALIHLYPKVSEGGYVIVDDYGALPPCLRAVHDYREQQGITDRILPVDWTAVYWRVTK
jgi:hypothetical protein